MVNKSQKLALYHRPQKSIQNNLRCFNHKVPMTAQVCHNLPYHSVRQIRPLNYYTLFFVTEETTTSI